MAKEATRSGVLRNTLLAKNIGSLRKRNPLSVDCCSLYLIKISSQESISDSKILVARTNLPALLVACAITSSLGIRVAIRRQ